MHCRFLLVMVIMVMGWASATEAQLPPVPELELRLEPIGRTAEGVELRLVLENVGKMPYQVMLPGFFYEFVPETMMGGYRLDLIGPDGKPALVKRGIAPPSPQPLAPHLDRVVTLRAGMSVGLRVLLHDDQADPRKVAEISASYVIKAEMLAEAMRMYEQNPHNKEIFAWAANGKAPVWVGELKAKPIPLVSKP